MDNLEKLSYTVLAHGEVGSTDRIDCPLQTKYVCLCFLQRPCPAGSLDSVEGKRRTIEQSRKKKKHCVFENSYKATIAYPMDYRCL